MRVVITLRSWCVPWGLIDFHALNNPAAWCPPPPPPILWLQAADWEEQFGPVRANAQNTQCPSQKNSWYRRSPTSTSCSTRSGSSMVHLCRAQARSTKRMLPHTKIAKFLKMYLKCHGGKKTIAGKRNIVHNRHTRFTKKYSKRNHMGLCKKKKQSVPCTSGKMKVVCDYLPFPEVTRVAT